MALTALLADVARLTNMSLLLVFMVGMFIGYKLGKPSYYSDLPSRYTVSKDGT
jgi:hypothetical protein